MIYRPDNVGGQTNIEVLRKEKNKWKDIVNAVQKAAVSGPYNVWNIIFCGSQLKKIQMKEVSTVDTSWLRNLRAAVEVNCSKQRPQKFYP